MRNELKKHLFKIQDESGNIKLAELLTVFHVKETGKEYAVYSIDNGNGVDMSLYVQILIKNGFGEDQLINITDGNEKAIIHAIVEQLMNS